MTTLAWYYSRKIHNSKDINSIQGADLIDFGEYWYHVGFDFVDGSRLIFNTLRSTNEIIETKLSDADIDIVENTIKCRQA
jgi:hypothetical protein